LINFAGGGLGRVMILMFFDGDIRDKKGGHVITRAKVFGFSLGRTRKFVFWGLFENGLMIGKGLKL